MARVAYVNGFYRPFHEASVHIEDRGYQFGDGVYEVIYFRNQRLVDECGHLDRLDRSLAELSIVSPMSRRALSVVLRETLQRNRLSEGIVYIQVTRGVARRDHAFPHGTPPSIVITVRRLRPLSSAILAQGVSVITLPDIRWDRRDIKSIGLLPNVLGKQKAKEAGAYEAWLVDAQGHVTEGTSTNAWIVTQDGALMTRPTGNAILSGITRQSLMGLAQRAGVTILERAFTVAEAKAAAEAFLSSTTTFALPVVRIDDTVIGDGRPGPVTRMMRIAYQNALEAGELA